jgi:anti-sigma regulatory factor (Ser/Thr protein kinase)
MSRLRPRTCSIRSARPRPSEQPAGVDAIDEHDRVGFRHDAIFYSGLGGFLDAVVPFIEEGVRGDEPILVAVAPEKIERIKASLNGGVEGVEFANMDELGRNPARIIPAWREFVARNGDGGHFRGIGEPIWPGRSEAELAECHLHESLLNVAFDDGPAWWLVCPYDTSALEADFVAEARRTHARVLRNGAFEAAAGTAAGSLEGRFDRSHAEPPAPVESLHYDLRSLGRVRHFIAARAGESGLGPRAIDDLIVAVNEATTNSVRYGGGGGTLRIWEDGRTLICELRDNGHIDDPLVGRRIPTLDQEGGRGLWLANQLCDLVQVRSLPEGVVVRIHVALG